MPKGNVKEQKKSAADPQRTAGKLKKGRLVDGEIVFEDDEDEEDDELDEDEEDDEPTDEELDEIEDDEDEDEEPVKPAKKKVEAVKKKVESKKDDEHKVKPSQRAALPAEKRKVADEKITKKSKIVTVKDLESEYGLEGKKLRRIIRGLGYKAPDVAGDPSAFGAKKKYEWASDSPHLKKIIAAIKEELED